MAEKQNNALSPTKTSLWTLTERFVELCLSNGLGSSLSSGSYEVSTLSHSVCTAYMSQEYCTLWLYPTTFSSEDFPVFSPGSLSPFWCLQVCTVYTVFGDQDRSTGQNVPCVILILTIWLPVPIGAHGWFHNRFHSGLCCFALSLYEILLVSEAAFMMLGFFLSLGWHDASWIIVVSGLHGTSFLICSILFCIGGRSQQ